MSYHALVITSFISFIVGFSGGADSWLFWTVKLGVGGYSQSTLVVDAAKAVSRGDRVLHFRVQGRINRTVVNGIIANSKPNGTELEIPDDYYSSGVSVFWNGEQNGYNIQGRSSNFVESNFINTPTARVHWGPLSCLIGGLLLVKAVLSPDRPRIRIHLPLICDVEV